jgi:hypothetical protein
VLDQARSDLREPAERHEEDDRARRPREHLVVERAGVMAARDRHLRGDAAVGDRDPGRGGHGAQGRHARNDLELDPHLGECERLLAPAPEDEGVAALQADHVVALTAEADEQRVDLLLLVRVAGNEDRVGARLVDELLGDEAVVDEHVAAADELEPARGDQTGVAGTGTDEPDGHSSDSATSPSKKSRRSS